MSEPMIELRGLKKYFEIDKGIIKKQKTYVKAVDDITLTINEGEIVGLVGESGSGKTTLARVILSLTARTGGDVVIDGIDISEASRDNMKKLHREVAVVFQDPASNLNLFGSWVRRRVRTGPRPGAGALVRVDLTGGGREVEPRRAGGVAGPRDRRVTAEIVT